MGSRLRYVPPTFRHSTGSPTDCTAVRPSHLLGARGHQHLGQRRRIPRGARRADGDHRQQPRLLALPLSRGSGEKGGMWGDWFGREGLYWGEVEGGWLGFWRLEGWGVARGSVWMGLRQLGVSNGRRYAALC